MALNPRAQQSQFLQGLGKLPVNSQSGKVRNLSQLGSQSGRGVDQLYEHMKSGGGYDHRGEAHSLPKEHQVPVRKMKGTENDAPETAEVDTAKKLSKATISNAPKGGLKTAVRVKKEAGPPQDWYKDIPCRSTKARDPSKVVKLK